MWSPTQLALVREAGIAGNSLSAGLTALRKANYATPGMYSHAFFSLSIGLERTLKLIYILDHLLSNDSFPSNMDLKDVGHNIEKLVGRALSIKDKHQFITGETGLLADSIEMDIVRFMSRFAKTSRYYNLNYVTGAASKEAQSDPIADWYSTVGKRVLKKHFTKRVETRVRRNAEIISDRTGHMTSVQFTAEDGTPLTDVFTASYHTGKTDVLRKYGTLYAARLCRVIYYLLWGVERKCQGEDIAAPYLTELFFPFMNEDSYLLGIKTFPPRGQ